jgi:hypothetical protein
VNEDSAIGGATLIEANHPGQQTNDTATSTQAKGVGTTARAPIASSAILMAKTNSDRHQPGADARPDDGYFVSAVRIEKRGYQALTPASQSADKRRLARTAEPRTRRLQLRSASSIGISFCPPSCLRSTNI